MITSAIYSLIHEFTYSKLLPYKFLLSVKNVQHVTYRLISKGVPQLMSAWTLNEDAPNFVSV
jgi:hypothetical protein